MSTSVATEETKTQPISSSSSNHTNNIAKIRHNLKNLLNDLDHHDQILSKGFNDIQSLIDAQRKKFQQLSAEYDKARETAPADVQSHFNNPTNNKSESANHPFSIKMNSFPSIPTLSNLQLPPKREPIKIIPFKPIEIDYDFLNQQVEKKNKSELKPADDIKQIDDEMEQIEEKQNEIFSETEDEDDADTESMDEAMIKRMENEKSSNLQKLKLPKEVKQAFGDRKTWKVP